VYVAGLGAVGYAVSPSGAPSDVHVLDADPALVLLSARFRFHRVAYLRPFWQLSVKKERHPSTHPLTAHPADGVMVGSPSSSMIAGSAFARA
jgi:hypothetical protein